MPLAVSILTSHLPLNRNGFLNAQGCQNLGLYANHSMLDDAEKLL